jgi:acetoin utilization protein AcuB
MLVQDIMTSPVIAISPDISLQDAYQTMQEKGIRHLPVVEGEKLVGVITDRDLRLATSSLAPAPFPPGAEISAVMRKSLYTANPADPVEEAARLMREKKIGCLPVTDDDDRLVGIITGLDLLDALMRMTGADKPSGRLEVSLPDRPGELARLAGFISHRGLNIHSILTYPEGADRIRAVLRISSIEVRFLAQELRREDFDVPWPPAKPCLP